MAPEPQEPTDVEALQRRTRGPAANGMVWSRDVVRARSPPCRRRPPIAQVVLPLAARLRTRPRQISLSSFNGIAHLERAADAALITYR